MASPLEKARLDPGSMKAKILAGARSVFGTYGFHGTTTRMIAELVSIDISTLHYHWGDKKELYEACVEDIFNDMRTKMREVEKIIHNKPLQERMDIAIDMVSDYLFATPEISNIIILQYFTKTSIEVNPDIHVKEMMSEIARSMNLSKSSKDVEPDVLLKMIAMMNSIHSFTSGEAFFNNMLNMKKEEYRKMVKETLKFVLIPPFTNCYQE